ncbi:DUF72 domain-containing protein [Thermococcus argininiproducens]|uniref:DUF72 domain-containing protein n=1 Tax=Thermococcus argininiproducens TaxID=2866384 RepID=A0A9E7MA32_9EURY|nr:DUF72 domain-containing protein [Thermococcus argininiproducens]USG99717.1 DUF72 domain-containing protein [Thermococcus argininiproducens]
MIVVGTCGFCERREKYFRDFGTVEVQQTFYKLIRDKTLQKWRQEAPKDFIFSIKAFQGVTHPSTSPTWRRSNVKPTSEVGLLKPTPDVFRYWELTLREAEILGAKFVLIQLPKSFKETEENFNNAEKFFSKIEKREFIIAIELRGWSEKGIKEFVKEFGLIDVSDPFVRKPVHRGDINYYRLHGAYERGRIIYKHKYEEEELKEIASRIRKWNKKESYLYFNNAYMCEDARRFIQILAF